MKVTETTLKGRNGLPLGDLWPTALSYSRNVIIYDWAFFGTEITDTTFNTGRFGYSTGRQGQQVSRHCMLLKGHSTNLH